MRGVREISVKAANSENNMIFWEVVESSTLSQKSHHMGPCGPTVSAHRGGFSSVTTARGRAPQRPVSTRRNEATHLLGQSQHTLERPSRHSDAADQGLQASSCIKVHPATPGRCRPFPLFQLEPPLFPLVPPYLGR